MVQGSGRGRVHDSGLGTGASGRGRCVASELGGNNLKRFQDFHTEYGSGQGQSLALTGLLVSSSLDNGRGSGQGTRTGRRAEALRALRVPAGKGCVGTPTDLSCAIEKTWGGTCRQQPRP